MSLRFCSLHTGERARVTGLQGVTSTYRNRLLSMGMTPGTEFKVVRVAPLGDPVEIVLRGFRLSLRRHEAEGLLVELI